MAKLSSAGLSYLALLGGPLFIAQGPNGMQQRGANGRQNAKEHGNRNRAKVDQADAPRLDMGRDLIEVVDVARKDLLSRQPAEEVFEVIDIVRQGQPNGRSEAGTHQAEQQGVTEEDLHHAAVGRPQRL